jgi:DNA helicase-2/ATP-dependent DNA helicase PcrA
VLADTNQALYPAINLHARQDLQAIYPQAQVIALTKSYRSTYEIMNFAAALLGQKNENAAFLRHGEEPTILQSANPPQKVLQILETLPDDFNTVGVILPTIEEAKAFHTQLKKLLPAGNTPRPLCLIGAESQLLPAGIMVLAAPFAKGLEFDTVICPAYAPPTTPRQRKLFYLICTRALHRLYLI